MKTKLTFLLLLVTIFILLLKTTTSAQTVNFAINVTDSSILADKSVCITNANDLDKETQEKLKLR
jgi:hypothetical protein